MNNYNSKFIEKFQSITDQKQQTKKIQFSKIYRNLFDCVIECLHFNESNISKNFIFLLVKKYLSNYEIFSK